MMLGSVTGGVVRLAEPAGGLLMVGEGIETCLSAMQATGNPTWSALSTAGLRKLDLPEMVREVIILADGDDSGIIVARECATRWLNENRRVKIARPPLNLDFNDLICDGEGVKQIHGLINQAQSPIDKLVKKKKKTPPRHLARPI